MAGANGDLWTEIFGREQRGNDEAFKIDSHQGVKAVEEGDVPLQHWLGNALADVAAGAAATLARPQHCQLQ